MQLAVCRSLTWSLLVTVLSLLGHCKWLLQDCVIAPFQLASLASLHLIAASLNLVALHVLASLLHEYCHCSIEARSLFIVILLSLW